MHTRGASSHRVDNFSTYEIQFLQDFFQVLPRYLTRPSLLVTLSSEVLSFVDYPESRGPALVPLLAKWLHVPCLVEMEGARDNMVLALIRY